jgi:N-methylhydantoinase A
MTLKRKDVDAKQGIVTGYFSAFGNVDQPTLPEISVRTSGSLKPIGSRDVYQTNGKRISYAIYHRDDFCKEDEFEGPAIVNEHTGTTLIHPGDSVTIGSHGEIVISLGKGN